MIGEGEATLAEIVDKLINNKKYLNYDDLNKIDGIAFNKIKFLKKSGLLYSCKKFPFK